MTVHELVGWASLHMLHMWEWHLSGCCLLLSCHRAAVLPPGVVVSALVQVRVVNPLDLSAQDRHTL